MNNGKKGDPTIIHKVSWHLRYCTTGFNSKNKSTFIQSDKKKSCENMDLYKLKESKDDFIAVDSFGVKVANRGEQMREKQKVYRGWVNHVVIDVNTKEIVAIEQMREEMAKCRSH